MTNTPPLAPAEALSLHGLITPTDHGVASRVLARTSGGNVTLFAFDRGEELSEHTSPFDALVVVLEGSMTLAIGGASVHASAGDIVRMPAAVPHAVAAVDRARMLLIMLRHSND